MCAVKKNFQRLVLVFGLLSVLACTSLRVPVPTPLLRDPQVPGKTSFSGKLGLRHSKDVVAINAADSRPPDMSQSIGASGSTYYADVGMGISSAFSLGFDIALWPSLQGFNLTWQFLGPSRLESTSEGAWVGAIYGSYLLSTSNSNGSQQSFGGPGGYPWAASASLGSSSGGISFGNFIGDKALLFAGVTYSDFVLTSKVNQDVSSTGDSQGGTYTSLSRGWAYAPGVGLRFGRTFSVTLLAQYLTAQYFGNEIRNEANMAINVSLNTGMNPSKSQSPE